MAETTRRQILRHSTAVLAEGVEDRATWDLLAGLGCGTAQGFLMARPMPTEAATDWLRERKLTWVRTGPWAAL